MNRTIQRWTVLLVSIALCLAGCTTLRSVPIPKEPAQNVEVKVGDRVEVLTRDAQLHRFDVTAVEPDAIRGKDIRVAYSDMQRLSVVRVDAPKTAKGVLLALAVIVVAALAWGLSKLNAIPG